MDIHQIIKYSRVEETFGGHLVQAPTPGRVNFKDQFASYFHQASDLQLQEQKNLGNLFQCFAVSTEHAIAVKAM